MSARPPFNTLAAARAEKPAAPARGSLGWVKSVLGRSMRLENKRRGQPVAEPASPMLTEQRAELGARLLVHDPATQTVRNLFRVHDELAVGGWRAVEALPGGVVARALTEAEIIDEQDPSPMLGGIIERLREFKTASDLRAAADAAAEAERTWAREHPAAPEVSEGDYEEFAQMERSWVGTVPAGL